MTPHQDLPRLESERTRLYSDLASVGDFRPGTLLPVMRKCGKANCACAASDHPGHGPQHILTKKVAGKTVAKHLRPGPELEKATRETASYRRFRGLVEQLVEVNEQICETKPAVPMAATIAHEKGGPSPRRSRPKSGTR